MELTKITVTTTLIQNSGEMLAQFNIDEHEEQAYLYEQTEDEKKRYYRYLYTLIKLRMRELYPGCEIEEGSIHQGFHHPGNQKYFRFLFWRD
jgi:hypothetical protein